MGQDELEGQLYIQRIRCSPPPPPHTLQQCVLQKVEHVSAEADRFDGWKMNESCPIFSISPEYEV